MANYDGSIRISTKMDNSNFNKGAEEVSEKLDNIGEKAKKNGNIKISWSEEDKKAAEAQIDRILAKKQQLAESPDTSGTWNRNESAFDFEENASNAARIRAEIDAIAASTDGVSEKNAKVNAKLMEQEAEEQKLNEIRQNAVVSNQNLVDLLAEQERITERMALLKKAGAGEGYEEYDSLCARLSEVNSEIGKARNGFGEAEKSCKDCLDTIQSGARKSNNLLSGLTRRLKNLAIRLLIFRWIIKGFNAMINGMKEGFQNLAQYSTDYNKTLSELKSQTATLKNSFAAAFEPIADIVVSNFTRLVTWINKAMDTMTQFIAVLQGKSTYTKAKKQVIDYAKSLDTASKSAKKALASFDELNVLSKNDSADSGNGELTGADAFEEAEINPEIYEMLEKVKALLEYIKPLAIAVGIALLAWKIAEFLKDLGSVAANLKDAYAIIMFIAGVALLVYHYFNMWKDGVDWEGIKGYIAGVAMAVLALYLLFGPFVAGIALIVLGIAGLVLAFKDMCENGFTTENMVLALISAVMIVIGVFIAFGAVAALVVGAVLAVIGIFAAMIIWAGNGEEALNRLKNQFSLFGSFLKNVFAGDWKAAFKDISAFAIESLNQGTILVESFINCIIKGINWLLENLINIDVPDWVPIIGGTKWNYGLKSIPEVSLPRINIPELANGAVIQGGKPFAAILGDQPSGQTNIEAPLSTIVDALKQAMSETDGTGGSYTFVAQLDGRTIFKETVRQDQMQYKATGKGAFQH